MRLFAESRGYTVTTNFNQYIKGQGSNPNLGFTFSDFTTEIDAGRPVLIQVSGHTMLGYGYNTEGSIIYLRNTWDYNAHTMTWGGTYSAMQHYGVTVLELVPPTPPALISDFDVSDMEDSQATMSWTNPSDTDLAQVLVTRKTDSYPSDHTDGTTVYDDTSPTPGASINTVNTPLTNGITYYYAVFSRNTDNLWNDTVQPGSNADTAIPRTGLTTYYHDFDLGLDTDDCAGGNVSILEVQTGDPVLIGSYEAEFNYNGSILNVLDVRLKPPFDTGSSDIDNPAGLTQFNGTATAGAPAPVDLAFLPMRLVGCALDQCQGTLNLTSIVDVDGNPLGISPPEIGYSFQRGDARADGIVNVADTLFIAQYLVGLRDLGDGLDKVHAVNAASVKHDNGCDEIDIADVLFIAQHLVGIRDCYFEMVP